MKSFVLVLIAFLGIFAAGWTLRADEPTAETANPPAAAASDFGLTTQNSELTTLPLWREYLSGKRPIRIGLASAVSQVTLAGEGSFAIFVGEAFLRQGREGEILTFSGEMKEKMTLAPEEGKAWSVKVNDQPLAGRYPGKMEIFSTGSGEGAKITLVNEVPLEDYVAGVVEREMPSSFSVEALRAQAICARSYTLYYLGRHQAEGFDLCAQTHCQIYRGRPDFLGRPVVAAYTTRGQILVFQGQPVRTFYHSTCGGETANGLALSENPTTLPYLLGVPDAQSRAPLSGEETIASFLGGNSDSFCSISPKYRWQVSFRAGEINAIIQANLPTLLKQPDLKPGKVKSMRIAVRLAARVQALEIECESGTYSVQGNDIRWLFRNSDKAKNGLMSTFFSLSISRDETGNPIKYTFTGGGWGHGVGMCQYGAEGRARAGAGALEILAAYFPGTELWTEEVIEESEAANE